MNSVRTEPLIGEYQRNQRFRKNRHQNRGRNGQKQNTTDALTDFLTELPPIFLRRQHRNGRKEDNGGSLREDANRGLCEVISVAQSGNAPIVSQKGLRDPECQL